MENAARPKTKRNSKSENTLTLSQNRKGGP